MGNEEAVKILTEERSTSPSKLEAEVSLEATNQEGVNLAEDMEKEFERIQTQQESESEIDLKEVDMDALRSELQVTEEVLKREQGQGAQSLEELQEELKAQEVEEVESEIRVEVTPPDSPEPTFEEKDEFITNEVEVVEEKAVEEKPQEPKKQVTFESPKEFVISKDEPTPVKGEEISNPSGKSIVALNRELFEQSAPKGVKVKYSFKKDDAPQAPETPENKVANLKNFFQNLGSKGSKDDSNAVERRSGNKLGGVHPNRRTVAS